ncbi:MAG TPA: VWA domain-containing protein [Polyangiaceae bacterium]|nr:VWA domain-containing protein [Polyangiaceae bacterium]
MLFAGVPLSTLGLLAAGLAALTTLLYILKLRRRPVSVPFSPLWRRVLRDQQATHLFSELKRWLSLLLQLALLGLVLLALADPRFTKAWTSNRNRVVLVDVSASMQATDVEPTRLGVAQTKLREFIRGLPSGDRLLIAEMGTTCRALSSMTDDTAELSRAVDAIKATDTGADLERALAFARDSLRGLSSPEIVVISDGALSDTERASAHVPLDGIRTSYVPVGQSETNIAVSQFSVRRYPLDKGRYEVLLELNNTNATPADVELSLVGDGSVIDVTKLSLAAGERLPRIYSDLSGASRTLEARVRLLGAAPDRLSVDDRAYALMPERRRVRVLVVSPGNTYLEAALLLDEYLEVTEVAPSEALPSGPFDVTILDGVAPTLQVNHGARIYLNPPEGGPIKLQPKPITDFGFDTWDRQSPFLSFIAPEDIQAATGHAFVPESGDHVVGASELGPILLTGNRDGQRFVALSFDPRSSDFVLRVAWPLFLLNSINAFAAEDTRYLSSFRTGETWNIPVQGERDSVILKSPNGQQRAIPVKSGYAVTLGEYAGFFSLLEADGSELYAFAANMTDQNESQIKPNPELKLGTASAGPVDGFSVGVRRELWVYLLGAVLCVSLIEWFTYHRRLTV